MGALESLLSALGLKKAVAAAGMVGGVISGAILPGPLAALKSLALRTLAGGFCGAAIAWFCAGPAAAWLDRPDDVEGVAFCLGFAGLSIAFKCISTWNDFDLGGLVSRLINNRTGGNS